ncbi:hypothetical protein I4U23_023764 [Adineta vaga]|nr:hypothetical protein I4U23_023764 [Adineta vaga]
MEQSQDCLLTQTMLIELNPAVQFYSNFNRCLDLIKSIKDEQIFLIVSGAFARRVLSQTHHQRVLVAVFIFCSNSQYHQPLMQEYKAIREKMELVEKQTIAFSLFDQKQKSLKDLSKESASFLLHQMLVFVLRQMSQDQQAKQQMIDMCHDYYKNNKRELEKIKQFKRTYCREQAIEWYTDECFLYKLLNKALRTKDIELLYTFRFFIINLCSATENERQQLKDKEVLTLYRGAQIPSEELDKLKDNVGKVISTNGFLSTSRNINASLNFVHGNAITIGNIGRVYRDKEDFDTALTYFSRALEMFKRVLPNQNSNIAPCLGAIGYAHKKKGDLDVALDYYQQQLNMEEQCLPFDHPDLSDHLGWIIDTYKQMNEIEKALEFCQENLIVQKDRLGENHLRVARTLMIMGDLIEDNDPNGALQHYEEALSILQNYKPLDYAAVAECLIELGCLYTDHDMMEDALRCEHEALNFRRQIFPSDHVTIAFNLRNIGLSYEEMNNPSEALRYFSESLSIYRANYGPDHKDVKRGEEDIARLNNKDLLPSYHEEQQQENIKDKEYCSVSDSSNVHQPTSTTDSILETLSDQSNSNKTPATVQSKTCIIQRSLDLLIFLSIL